MRAIVTGHSRGIGAAVTAELLSLNIPVLGLARYRNPSLGQQFPERLQEVAIDLSDPEALLQWLASSTLEQFVAPPGPIILINNAGMLEPTGPLGSLNSELIVKAIHLNTATPLLLANAVAAHASSSHPVRIVHISSGAARTPYSGWNLYGASKALLDQHARCVQAEGSAWLRITSLAPGVVDTSMQAEVRGLSPTAFPSHARFVDLHASGSLLSAEACANRLVRHVLNDDFGLDAACDLRTLSLE